MKMVSKMRIYEEFEFMADFYTVWNEERAMELLAFFTLNPDMKISELSKGNKGKVNLLLGLALDVDYILIDEPFSGIDIFSSEQIADVFKSYLIEYRCVIERTHEIQHWYSLI